MNIIAWNQLFPIITDEDVETYENEVDEVFLEQAEEWFGVEERLNVSDSRHVVSTCLFWKNVDVGSAELPPLTEEVMKNARAMGLVSRFEPWPQYVQPLLDGAALLKEHYPDIGIRVYLANDLRFLAERLTENCEVFVMKSSSIRHAPGSMWRFLALDDVSDLLTVVGTDNFQLVERYMKHTEQLVPEKLGFWRYPTTGDSNDTHLTYRPMIACEWGARASVYQDSCRKLMNVFMWHYFKGNLNDRVVHPWLGDLPVFGTHWPGYGFDEWFLICALYPRLAVEGCLTVARRIRDSALFPLDIEYVTWMNSKSTIMFE